jgi:hypothetical protein
MNDLGDTGLAQRAELDRIEARLQETLFGRARNLRVLRRGIGIVLRGQAYSFYGKQLAQHVVMRATDLPIVANEIQVVGHH